MTNTSENLVEHLSDLYQAFDHMAVTFVSGHTTDAPPGSHARMKAETRKRLYDDAVAGRLLVEQLETINDRMLTDRRKLR